MKTKFKDFINKSIIDKMTPKSEEEEVKKVLNDLNPIEKLIKIKQANLPNSFKPTIKKIKKYVKNNPLKSKMIINNNKYYLDDYENYEPSDSDLKNYLKKFSIPEQIELTNNVDLIHFHPNDDEIIDYIRSLSKEEAQNFISKYKIINYMRLTIAKLSNIIAMIAEQKDNYIPINNNSLGKFIKNEGNTILLNIGKNFIDLYNYLKNSENWKLYFKHKNEK
jgi:hypothetical protein